MYSNWAVKKIDEGDIQRRKEKTESEQSISRSDYLKKKKTIFFV
jgi:hypothetical protein